MRKKFAPGPTYIEYFTAGEIHLSRMESSSRRFFRMVNSQLIQLMMLMAIMALGAATETPCEDDGDCPPHQFCYDVSNICVNYSNCSQFNREEGEEKAQSPLQCGKCLEGYASNTLATGEEEPVCKRKIQLPVDPPAMNDTSQWWIWVATGVGSSFVVGIVLLLLRKRLPESHEKWFKAMGTWKFTPSAPPQENAYRLQQPFYTDEEPPIYSSVITTNNNNNINAKERLVNAIPTTPPSWVRVDPSYDEEDGTVNTSGSTAVSMTIEVEEEETTPSSWTPENVTVEVPVRPFLQFGTEQRDNVLNSVLVRGDCRSNSSPTQDTTPEPSPESRERTRGGNTYRGTNVQINQMITLNMVKSDN
ncbi:uncharacterized protein [Fopius arisanus]|uniref:Uncharacterized protein isoform X2 n=1 Tax=Fopius arisanus TaxID=64838 RepID=A0A9R1T4K4_9HYME|nr:PREDICTED: uncharacterized protein LOC105266370 isoform X2 [Fopius arisanus]